jgi:hypothetical protein
LTGDAVGGALIIQNGMNNNAQVVQN